MVQKPEVIFFRRNADAANKLLLLLFASFFTLCLPASAQHHRHYSLSAGITADDYAPGIIVAKIKEAPSPVRTLSLPSSTILDKVRQRSKAVVIEHIVPRVKNANARQSSSGSVLDNIYKIQVAQGEDILSIINDLLNLQEVVYAEPYFLMKPLRSQKMQVDGYVPDDPEAAPGRKQAYLKTIRAYEAWEIEKGSPDVLIGILDTGVGLGHQDLMGNLRYNLADPVNGIDDDHDGYVDNYIGWDMADGDNDPTATDPHGSLVTGIAAATANNRTGIAGAGFHSSYLPVKIFSSADGYFYQGYEAIAYAADHGCQVINLSWGVASAYSSFAQDIINYAVLEKDVVVVAAAGNSGKLENFYPASYDHVLSVVVSDINDHKIAQTTHSYYADIMAPGSNSYTTANNDTYKYESGSSLSAPLVAGAAALVRAKYPAITALQVMEKLRLTTDNIYAVGNNAAYKEQLGYGRLNMKKALQPLNSPAIRMTSMHYQNRIGKYAFGGDTLKIFTTFVNYFKPSLKAMITLSTQSLYATVVDSVFSPGIVDSLTTVTNAGQPFTVRLSNNLPANETMIFRLGIEDGSYHDYQYFTIKASSDFLVVSNSNLRVSVGNEGSLVYHPGETFGGTRLTYGHTDLASQMGLIIGTDTTNVSDNTIVNLWSEDKSQDFSNLDRISVSLAENKDIITYSAFSDATASNPLNIRVEQQWLTQATDTPTASGSYLIAEYRVTSLSPDALQNLHAGLFADWNIGLWKENKASWDAAYQLGYAYDGTTYAGVALLSPQQATHHAIDWKGLNGNTAEVADIFTDANRFAFLSSTTKLKAGEKGAGNDVAYVVGGKTDTISQYQSKTFAFAIVAGSSLAALQQAVIHARQHYEDFLDHPLTSHVAYACEGKPVLVAPEGGHLFRFYSDPAGENLLYEGQSYMTGPVLQDTSVYYTNIDQGYESRLRQAKIEVEVPVAQFAFMQNGIDLRDTLFIEESGNHTVAIQSTSTETSTWDWNLGNGFKSTKQHPVTNYQPGQYKVTLKAFNKAGCADTISRNLVVLKRSPAPVIPHAYICPGASVALTASNATSLRFYTDAATKNLVHQGSSFTTGAIASDTSFYVVNTDSVYTSLPYQVDVTVINSPLDITYALDTVRLSPKYALQLTANGNLSNVTHLQWYINDVQVAQESSFVYDYASQHAQNKPLYIRLDYTTSNHSVSCQKSITKTVNRVVQEVPELSFAYDCRNNQAGIVPKEGSVYYYYENKALDSVIYKGRCLLIDQVTYASTYYVTRMDGLKESAPVALKIGEELQVSFDMSADTLYLPQTREVAFEATYFLESDAAKISWLWDLGNHKFVSKPYSFTHRYDSAGTYTVRLKAKTAAGCEYTAEKKLVVVSVTDIARLPKKPQPLRIYPVPSSGKLTIEHAGWAYEPVTIRLLTFEGKIIYSKSHWYGKDLSVDFSGVLNTIGPQWYLLQLETTKNSFFQKVLFLPVSL